MAQITGGSHFVAHHWCESLWLQHKQDDDSGVQKVVAEWRSPHKSLVQQVLDQVRFAFPGPHDSPPVAFTASEAVVRSTGVRIQAAPNQELDATKIPTCEASSADQDSATNRVAVECPLSRSCCNCGNDWTAGVLLDKDNA